MFHNREDAGRQLAATLGPFDANETVVLALPRGGVPVAAQIAKHHGLPLDLVFVRKIGAPGQPELALGAVVDGPEPVIAINTSVARAFGLSDREVRDRATPLLAEIEQRRTRYLGGRAPLPLAGKTVLVVDDGVATGASFKAALDAVKRRKPARIIAALPVAPAEVLDELRELADEVVCLETPQPFIAVGAHYRDFSQTGDDAVIAALAAAQQKRDGGKLKC